MERDFLPVILGTDWNAYGVASSIYEEYCVKSVSLGMRRQIYTNDLDYLDVHVFDNFDTSEVFVKELLNFAKEHKGEKLLLISCGDYYTGLIVDNMEDLKEYYIFNYIDSNLRDQLENKKDFYNICEKYGLDYPDTFIVSKDNYLDFELPFSFPVVCKPNDSFKWLKVRFEGYKKAYIIDNMDELKNVLKLSFDNGYDDDMIIQDYIPGGPESMFVVNAYVDQNSNVTMTHGAQAALDECLPNDIGNYNALISGDYPELSKGVKKFLEQINYKGFANFDLKYDSRDSKYKVFEINLRQGRSSMHMTYAGNNFTKYLVEDMIYGNKLSYFNNTKSHLWYLVDKSVLKKYSPSILKDKINKLISEGKSNYGFDYASNLNIKRFLLSLRRKISTVRYYRKYMR